MQSLKIKALCAVLIHTIFITLPACSTQNNTRPTVLPDCGLLVNEISTLNNDTKYTIPLWQNPVLLFSDQKLSEIKTSYDAVYIYLLGKHGIFTDQQELESLWNSQPERFIKSIKWEAYKKKLKRLAEERCRDFTNH
jgi:hypothetical protein